MKKEIQQRFWTEPVDFTFRTLRQSLPKQQTNFAMLIFNNPTLTALLDMPMVSAMRTAATMPECITSAQRRALVLTYASEFSYSPSSSVEPNKYGISSAMRVRSERILRGISLNGEELVDIRTRFKNLADENILLGIQGVKHVRTWSGELLSLDEPCLPHRRRTRK